MKKPEKKALNAYFAEGDSWAFDRQDGLRRSRSAAWIIAALAAVVAVCEAFALMSLAPLKTVVPYTLLVDKQTGFVQALKPLDPQLIAGDAALTQSFLVQYVIAREGYDYNSLQNDYRKVALWSEGQARSSYIARMQASNPSSPLAQYPRSTTIDVEVKSVSSIGNNTAMVRFDTVRDDAGRTTDPARAWVAIVHYVYTNTPMSARDRFLNPLGFEVVSYRRNPEIVPASGTSLPAPQNGKTQAQP